jgi:hypothetical protein
MNACHTIFVSEFHNRYIEPIAALANDASGDLTCHRARQQNTVIQHNLFCSRSPGKDELLVDAFTQNCRVVLCATYSFE